MKRSWVFHVATVRDVPIFIHGTFLLLIAWIMLGSNASLEAILFNVFLTVAIFFCVLLHECGHVFTAQGYGIKTRDIILYPFGGIATVLSDPKPKQELVIALAGPAVNIVIALLLFPFSGLSYPLNTSAEFSFLAHLTVANITLAVFNMIPALPMDGGRVLRSILAIFNVKSATTIAARTSQVVSIGMGLYGLTFNQPMLVVIAIFVFLGSFQEMMHVRTKEAVSGRTAADLVCQWDKLYTFTHGTTLSAAMNTALRTTQEYFPIVYQEQLLGIAHREDLIRVTATSGDEHYVSEAMDRDFTAVDIHTPLGEALEKANARDVEVLAVLDQGAFVGFLYPKNITEFMLIDGLRQNPPVEEAYTE